MGVLAITCNSFVKERVLPEDELLALGESYFKNDFVCFKGMKKYLNQFKQFGFRNLPFFHLPNLGFKRNPYSSV